MTEPWALSASAAASAIGVGRLDPVELVDALLDRIERLDPDLQAWARVVGVQAREDARRLGREARSGQIRGPLHGVPIALKDNLYTAGIETNVGSPMLAGFVPDADAALVRRLRESGAIVLGKTAMTVFAAMDPAPTRNPWNLEHTPGGSSSGSAAAVSAYLAPVAVGSQTAGSIIRPAAYCGVVGLKPTYGAVDRSGLFPCAWSMDHAGPLARTVADAALAFGVMAGVPSPAVAADLDGIVVGVPDRYFAASSTADTTRALEQTLDWIRAAGGRVVEFPLPMGFEAGVDAGVITMYAEMAAVHRDRYRDERERFSWKLACLLDAGLAVSAADYLRAQQIRRIATAELSAALDSVDCLLTPSTPAPAPRGLGATGDWTFNLPFSATGHPALTVPVGLSAERLPLGAQLVARHHGEARLFRVGAAIEAAASMPPSPYRSRP
jgi:Asp-tRNA(Asn)/Glu-tRNA(Gln) amidotransferase A subunit family amidase